MADVPKKSMTLKDLTLYLNDLIKMGFVLEYKGKDGTSCYKLTELGEKAGISGNFKKH